MIEFHFIVPDLDATNIIDCINQEINRTRDQLNDLPLEQQGEYREWYGSRIKYLNGLISKMKHKRIDE